MASTPDPHPDSPPRGETTDVETVRREDGQTDGGAAGGTSGMEDAGSPGGTSGTGGSAHDQER